MANFTRISGNTHVDCKTCNARTCGLCAGWPTSMVDVIAGYKTGDRKIRAGQDLFSLGDPCDAIYNLVEGWSFRYTLLEDGSRQILDFAFPGAVLGYHPEAGATFAAQALTDCVVCVIPHTELVLLSHRYPEVGFQLARLISQDRSLAFAHLTNMGRRSARERVAYLLLELFVRCRAEWPGCRIEDMALPVTQEHIGDATGLTGVHVNRVLGDLSRDGILKFCYRRLSILDPDRLMDLAGIDPELLQSWTGTGFRDRRPHEVGRKVARGGYINLQPDERAARAHVTSRFRLGAGGSLPGVTVSPEVALLVSRQTRQTAAGRG